jgi:transaldolase/glucose-6-phosphate isomerase
MINPQTYKLPDNLAAAVNTALDGWRKDGKARRLWRQDASVWTGADEGKWLGWLSIVEAQLDQVQHLTQIAQEVKGAGFKHALLLGMGGSSLCPEVMRETFGKVDDFPELHVLDSTDPAQIKAMENRIDFAKTIFIVSSKSGGTLEPTIFKQYFFERAKQVVGEKDVGSRFMVITDPLCRRGNEWRHLGPGARVLPDDRWTARRDRAPRSDFQDAGARTRKSGWHSGPRKVRWKCGRRLPALRAGQARGIS